MSTTSSDNGLDNIEEDNSQRTLIREELSAMTFEEIIKLKEELGAKVYKEAMLGVGDSERKRKANTKKDSEEFRRLNKNRPRELSAKKQVPYLGAELRTKSSSSETTMRDPRFDENSGQYDVKKFKEDYKFVSKIRQKEVLQLKKRLQKIDDAQERSKIKTDMQRLANQNVEERKWHAKQAMLKKEQKEMQLAHEEGKKPHYTTKREQRTKELVNQFEYLKKTGKLNKHLEKRRKKNVSKDRKVLKFD